ncbi:MAG TPA: redoxin domain-containing protein [Tissierellaceae bacterium]|nr:redoxin domain-containing protein [Tissierellaceae bacterium]
MNKNVRNLIIILVLSIALGGAAYYALNKDNKEDPLVLENKFEDQEDISKEDSNTEDNKESEEDKKYEDNMNIEDLSKEDNTDGPRVSIEEGEKLPDFTLNNLEGDEVSLSDYEDKIIFINFWATWCGFCDEEMPDLQKLNDENDDLVVLGVNVAEEQPIVKDYIEDGGYDFEVLLDEEGDLAMDYLAMGLPTTHFVNKEGISRGQISGMLTYEQMNEILEDIRKN